jgi:hypothetical protein
MDYERLYNPIKSKFYKIFNETVENGYLSYPPKTLDEIDYCEIIQNPLFFFKEYISKNKPCKIINAIEQWPALENWSDINYLKEKMKETETNKITVDITPDGFADSIHGKYFA